MAKYVNENVAQKIANDINKNRVLLGAFDTLDTSNANYNLISRNTWVVDLGTLSWTYSESDNQCWVANIDISNNADAICNNYVCVKSSYTGLANGQLSTNWQSWGSAPRIIVKNGSSIIPPSGVLQFQLSSSYTEKVIKGVPIHTLDQNGEEWLRSEWEKGLNSWNIDMPTTSNGGMTLTRVNSTTYVVSGTTSGYPDFNFGKMLFKKGRYILSKVDVLLTFFWLGTTQGSNDYLNTTLWEHDVELVFTQDTELWVSLVFQPRTYNNETIKFMLVEGDHAYPYQPYNGAIVHEKEIENIAKTNVNNNFSHDQTIKGNTNTPLGIYAKSGSSKVDFDFGIGSSWLASLRVKTDKLPYWGMSGAGEYRLLTEDDIAELKSLVYDNSYPAVKTIKFNTFQALPNSIDGDSLIFGAGSDMTNIDGMSVVVNQLVQNGDFSNGITDWTTNNASITTSTNEVTFVGTANDCYIQQTYAPKIGHVYLGSVDMKVNGTISSGSAVGLWLYGLNTRTEVHADLSNTSSYQTLSAIETCNSSNNYLFRIYNNNTVSSVSVKNAFFVDLTQFFGSNDNIPSDLLSNPSLFTSKYWKGSLAYDTGHIESAKPKAIISNPFNIFDEITESGAISTSTGQPISNSDYIRSSNFISVVPNSTYYLKSPYAGYVFYYDKDRNFISVEYMQNYAFAVPSNCYFLKISEYTSTYNNDICINISNATMNGTYLPHIAPKRYPISVGTGNSVNGVNTIKDIMGVLNTDRKVGKYTFTGSESWGFQRSGTAGDVYAISNLLPVGKGSKSDLLNQVMCSNGYYNPQGGIYAGSSLGIGFDGRSCYICIPSGANPNTIFASGVEMIYELHPDAYYTETNPQDTDFPSNIEIQKGGSLEIESDLPCDITLEVAVSKVY